MKVQIPKLAITVIVVLFSIFVVDPFSVIIAAPPNGVDHLRGRWDGNVESLEGIDQPLRLFLNDFAPDPNDSSAMIAGGCLAIGYAEVLAPIAARAINLGDGNFDLTVLGTAVIDDDGFTIQLEGQVDTLKPGVAEDSVSGEWTTAEGEGNWSATHHDRRRTKCPPLDQQPGLYFGGDVSVRWGYESDTVVDRNTMLEGFTNIVSTGMLVQRPDGTITIVPYFTDIFSPDVDFITEFRYLKAEPGDPVSGQVYTFTLIDALGDPIPGTTQTDIWTVCKTDVPRNLIAVVKPSLDINLSWGPVPIVPGFDPSGGVGFYQIELHPSGAYGANLISSPNHLIPWDDFGGSAPGSPDGFDRGVGLNGLVNGNYELQVVAFSQPDPANPGRPHECAVWDFDENLHFTKGDNSITFFTP